MNGLALTFEHWTFGALAVAALAAIVAIAVTRRPAVPAATLALAAIGGVLLALAAGGLALRRPAGSPVAVFVDLSPSTRGAAYRDPAALQRRLKELLGDTPYDLRFFAEQTGEVDRTTPTLPDLSATRTVLPAADAPAVVLFSDGRLATPDALPPVFAVIDSEREHAADAAVTSLDVRPDAVAIGVRNTGAAPRLLALRGVEGEGTVTVAPGSFTITRKLAPNATAISATLAPGDAWPENDALRANPPPPAVAERWWIGTSQAPDGWRAFTPSSLPTDAGSYLAASTIVLDNVPTDALDDARRAALHRYVRDLGGGLLVLGGDRAFAAGAYAGTVLDDLSPLASTPPEPVTHWVFLADASGSMNQPAGTGTNRTRWQYAADAVVSAIKRLPPADLLTIGSFAADVRWWSRGKGVAETLKLPLPQPDVQPRGQTNLDAALRRVAADADEKLATELLVATDAQAEIDAPDELARQLKARRVRMHVLLIGEADNAKGVSALKSIVAGTGGTFRDERLPENWAAGLRDLLRAARTAGVEREPVTVRLLNELASLPQISVPLWNRTWPKSDITPLAEANRAAERLTMSARWNVGEGRVAAAAFAPPPGVVEALTRVVERPPRDPRFRVTWEAGSVLRVVVDAVDGATYVNGERLTLELDDESRAVAKHAVPQTAPGRYELRLDAPRHPALARLRHDGRMIDARAIAERYAPEFDAVGNDRSALSALARRTGGAVIEPGVIRRLDELPRARRHLPLTSILSTTGAALIAAGLVRWRVGT